LKKLNKILDVNISKTKVVFNLDDKWKFRISILTNDIIDKVVTEVEKKALELEKK